MVVEQPAPTNRPFRTADLVPAIPGVLTTLFGIWAVHKLTKGREREKSVFELYRAITDSAHTVGAAADAAWGASRGPERKRAIAETKWRIQQLGATVERLRILSGRARWQWRWPFRIDVTIVLRTAMPELRQQITLDPFEDPTRNADKSKFEAVELAVGDFLSELDQQIFRWMR